MKICFGEVNILILSICIVLILLILLNTRQQIIYSPHLSTTNKVPVVSAGRLLFDKCSIYEWNWDNMTMSMATIYKAKFGVDLSPGKYTSRVIDQHNEKWCGCCYLVSVLQMLQDRLHIVYGAHTKKQMHPIIEFDRQLALDTYNEYQKLRIDADWNACRGGNPLNVLRAIDDKKCELRITSSRGSKWFGYPQTQEKVNNSEMNTIPLSEYKQLQNNIEYIKHRIFKYGPVVIGIRAQCMLDIGENGLVDTTVEGVRNHAMTVVGWCHLEGQECWIGRNSWGVENVPSEKPNDMTCVVENKNECSIPLKKWKGASNLPGYVYIPTSYKGIKGIPSPWYDAIPVSMRNILKEEANEQDSLLC